MDKYSICTECGSKMTYRTNLEYTHGGVTVKPVKGFRCEKCGEIVFEHNEAKRIEKKYVEPQESEDDRE